MAYKYWTVGEQAKLVHLYPNLSNAKLAEIFGRSAYNLQQKAIKLGLRKTAAYMAQHSGRFNTSQVPWNKGQTYRAPGAERTHFAAGHLPHNTLPLGAERIDSGGLLMRKVAETRKKEIDWRPVKDLTYLELHGEIPTGRFVIHANRDRLDFRPENLIAVTRGENLNRNENRKAAQVALRATWAKRKSTPLARYLALAASLMKGD